MWVDSDTQINGLLSLGSPIIVEKPHNHLGIVDSTSESSFAKSGTHPIDTSHGIQKRDSFTPRTRSTHTNSEVARGLNENDKDNETTSEMTSDSSIIDMNISEDKLESGDLDVSDGNLAKIPKGELSTREEKNYINIPPLADEFMNDQAYMDMELNSSPIKPTSKKVRYREELSSSPIKKKKSVAFSDDLVSELPSSPAAVHCGSRLPVLEHTPKKSILKINSLNQTSSPCNPNDTSLWVKSSNNINIKNSPSNPEFWLLGTIIQLAPNSPDLPQLIDGCINVLRDKKFSKKFEVYATLNHICRCNTSDSLLKLLTIPSKSNSPQKINSKSLMKTNSTSFMDNTYIHTLSAFIQRDVKQIELKLFCENEEKENNYSPSKNDPFSIRIISQALKVINFIMLDQELNNFVSIEDAKWFYVHCCKTIVKPTISKTLIIPYLSILKDCKFNNKKKKLIFNNQNENANILELILQSLLNMRKFVSSSLVVEEFVTLKNLVLNFPVMMANNFKHWFEFFLMNLCDLSSPLYSKVIGMGILVLLEVARNYLDNKNVLFSVRRLLASPLPSTVKSITSDSTISVSPEAPTTKSDENLVIHFIISTLETLIGNGQYKSAMDIWVGVTLLSSDSGSGYENWPFLSDWLRVHKSCFNVNNNSAKMIALNSWKAVIFNVCHNDLDSIRCLIDSSPNSKSSKSKPQAINNILKPKIKLLIHPLLNISAVENQKEIIDSSHNLFLSIIYTLLNPLVLNSSRYVHVYWDKIIQSVFINFYFKKELSNTYMNELGLKILTRLIKPSVSTNEKPFNEMRCLSNESISLNDISPVSPKWIFSKFDRILQNINIVFKLEGLTIDSKLEFFNNFLNSLKLITKKEIKPSDATQDIIDNLPNVLSVLFKHNKLSYSSIQKLMLNLNDTFDASNLIEKNGTRSNATNIYILIINNCLSDMEELQAFDFLESIHLAIRDSKNLIFLLELVKLQEYNTHAGLKNFIVSALNSRKINAASNLELELAGNLFQIISKDYESIAKKLIQSIVLLSATEFERVSGILDIQLWTIPIFKYFVELVHNAPHPHLKQIPLNLIISRFENDEEFFEILKFLIDKRFDLELYNLRKNIMKKFKALEGFRQFEFRLVWNSYLSNIVESGNFKLLDDFLVSSYEVGLDVRSHIQNKWDRLPLLKKAWLTDNSKLYFDSELLNQTGPASPGDSKNSEVSGKEDNTQIIAAPDCSKDLQMDDMETIESIENIAIPKLFSNSNKDSKTNRYEKRNMSSGSDISQLEIDNLTKSKANRKRSKSVAKPKPKKKTNIKVKKENTPAPEVNPNFDIHSFTAMLNAKLSPATPIKKARRNAKSNLNKSSPDNGSNSESCISPSGNEETIDLDHIKSEVQIPSSFNDDDISQLEASSMSQNSINEFDLVEDEPSSPPETLDKTRKSISPSSNDYSKVIQNGFSSRESSDLSDDIENTDDQESTNYKRKTCYDEDEISGRKKQKQNEFPSDEKNDNGTSAPESGISMTDESTGNSNLDNHIVHVSSSDQFRKDVNDSIENDEIQCSATSDQTAPPTFDTQDFRATSTALAEPSNTETSSSIQLSDSYNSMIPNLPPVHVGDRSEDFTPESDSKSNNFLSTIGEDDEIDSQNLKEKEDSDNGPQDEGSTTNENSELQPCEAANNLTSYMENMSDVEISRIPQSEKYQLETKLMTFILRMRNIDSVES